MPLVVEMVAAYPHPRRTRILDPPYWYAVDEDDDDDDDDDGVDEDGDDGDECLCAC